MRSFAHSLLLFSSFVLASGCAESVQAPANAVAETMDSASAVDSSPDSSPDSATASDADAGQDATADALIDTVADTSGDSVADSVADSAADQTADVKPADAKPTACTYTCALDCVCKKDKQGCDVAECEVSGCAGILAKIDQIKPKLQACSAPAGCEEYEFPICGSAGCFQMPVAKGADLAELNKLTSAAMAEKCSQFSCGCAPAAPSFCLSGTCRQCPPDCDAGTCDEKAAAIAQLVGANSWCTTAKDCIVHQTGLCPFAGLPCGGVALNKYANIAQLNALLAATALPCNIAMCKCAVPGPASCVAGKCTVQ